MNRKYILGFLILAILVITGGVYIWKISFVPEAKNQLPGSLQKAVSQVEKAGTPEVGSDWKPYQPKKLQLTFKYPPNLLIQETSDGIHIYANTPENRAFIQNPSEYEGSRPGMSFRLIDSNQTPEDFAQKSFPDQPKATVTLFGGKALVLAGQGMDQWDMILFSHDHALYQITIQYASLNDPARKTFYGILSSVHFLQ
ncbi:MAG TPA: hypothetical protein VFM02_03505 [Candidatus Paceibacterota bacterium]|nr:hypothetical protein [Candidatus Paceibacterota bacterium]